MSSKKNTLGITVKKSQDFSEWYTQLLQKAELIEYSAVSGCYILRPNSYHIWEKVQEFFDKLIKADGVKNAYFPLFIPESLLAKEEKHIQGFAAEVAWVESGGNSKLQERLAVRPTSETIINDSYAKWIRSHQDLPLRLNQWCNVVRWEFKHPVPLLRSREFLWQEGHTAFATKEEAVKETYKILDFYEKVFTELAAIPVLKGMKSKTETFAGAEFSLSLEALLPNGKAVQGCTSHHLGQNFAKAFNITFQDEKQQSQYVWQNSWGITTRVLGILIMIHSDDKGLVLPPKLALTQAVIVPILFDDSRAKVLKETERVKNLLEKKGISVHVDDRDGYSPGWKFNEWEMKGVPIRIELGPKDLEKKEVTVVRRDTGEKQSLPLSALDREIALILEQMQQGLYAKADKFLKQSISKVENLKDAEKVINSGKIVFVPWCGTEKCEEKWKEKTGAKSLNSPLEQPKMKKDLSCFACKEKAHSWFYVGRSY
ncbi:MAG TPA: proline--tRNA ligase [Candidatus Nanoarchaeia archaeon]|nr:proline--tRNA ligase [Candidatus Nanoarchaeia archaeon]